MIGWSPAGPVASKLPIKEWWATFQKVAFDAGLSFEEAFAVVLEIADDHGTSMEMASNRLLSALLTSDAGSGTDRLPITPKFNVMDTGTALDKLRPGVRMAERALALELATNKLRALGADFAKGVDWSKVPKIGTKPTDRGVDSGIGSIAFTYHNPEVTSFTTAGGYTYRIPVWSRMIECVMLGGGASGQTGNGGNNTAGKGGKVAAWGTLAFERGVSIPWDFLDISAVVGPGGGQPANSDFAGPNAGGTTRVYGGLSGSPDFSYVSVGGSGTASGQNGESTPNYVSEMSGWSFTGGSGGTGNGGNGSAPGGAGAGGNGGIFSSRTRGGSGAAGLVWFRATS